MTYDHDQQVTDLTSTNPAIKAAAVDKLNAHVQQVRDANPNSTPMIEYAVIKRTVTVEVYVPIDSYRVGKGDEARIMTQDEIREYEVSRTGEDGIEAFVEAVGVADEERIDQACTVTFRLGTPDQSDV